MLTPQCDARGGGWGNRRAAPTHGQTAARGVSLRRGGAYVLWHVFCSLDR